MSLVRNGFEFVLRPAKPFQTLGFCDMNASRHGARVLARSNVRVGSCLGIPSRPRAARPPTPGQPPSGMSVRIRVDSRLRITSENGVLPLAETDCSSAARFPTPDTSAQTSRAETIAS